MYFMLGTLIGTVYTIAIAFGGFSFGVYVCKKAYEEEKQKERE